jgi:ABC-type antimicrobial peptide transport system permease subunit
VQKARLTVRRGNSGWSELQQEYAKPLVLLQMLVLVVLLICCANLSGLFLARAAARQQEFAIRAALGAARSRLMRQLFVESLMLALPGALLGVALAWLAGPWLVHMLGSAQRGAKISLSMSPDVTVLSVTAACAVLCALLFGMAPAWAAGHTSMEAGLRGTQTRVAKGSSGARRFFVPFQVALSLVLVVVAALLGSTIGIYGLLAWSVTQRTREIGVRMALGATRLRVFVLVMRQVAVLLSVGVAVGGVAAFFAARSVRSFLFEVEAGDPIIFAISALALVLIGLLAAMLPARRAVSIDPMRALRTE